MMIYEPYEDDLSINIVTWSGATIGEDKAEGKNLVMNSWVRKEGEKSIGFNMQRDKEKFMEANKIFMELGASTSRT